MYLLRNAYESVKEQLKENRAEIDNLKEQKLDKMDFKEFKVELWGRLDRLEDKVTEQLRSK